MMCDDVILCVGCDMCVLCDACQVLRYASPLKCLSCHMLVVSGMRVVSIFLCVSTWSFDVMSCVIGCHVMCDVMSCHV